MLLVYGVIFGAPACAWLIQYILMALQIDVKNHKTFLKRTLYESVRPDMLYIGATVNVYNRQLLIRGFGDEFTRKKMERNSER